MELLSQLANGLLNFIGKGQPETPEQRKTRILNFLIGNLKMTEEQLPHLEKELSELAQRFEYPFDETLTFFYWIQKDLKAEPSQWFSNFKYGLKLARTFGRRSCLTLTKEDVLPGLKWEKIIA